MSCLPDLWHSSKWIVVLFLLPFYDIGNSALRLYCRNIEVFFLGSEPGAPSVFIIINSRDKVQVVNVGRTHARLASLWFAILIQLLRLYFKFIPIPSWNSCSPKVQEYLSACKSSKCLNSIWIFNLSTKFCFLSMIYLGESENFPTLLYRFCWLYFSSLKAVSVSM